MYFGLSRNDASSMTVIGGGIIGGNITWAANGSPYIVTEDLLIDEDATLTIEPGVEVRFAGNYSIYVSNNAILMALGTKNKPVIFTSNGTSYPGAWGGIQPHGDTAVIYFKDCKIMYASKAIGNEEYLSEHYNITIINCELTFNDYGMKVYQTQYATITVVNSTIKSNNVGIYLHPHGEVKIIGCEIVSNNIGIYSSGVTIQSLMIVNNTIMYNRMAGMYLGTQLSLSFYNLTVKGNTIMYNSGPGMYLCIKGQHKIRNNCIVHNEIGIKYYRYFHTHLFHFMRYITISYTLILSGMLL